MNQLFYGDNLDILRTRIDANSIDLCYIDPPFNSNRDYSQIYNNEDVAQAIAFTETWEWGQEAIQGLEYIKDTRNLNSGKVPQPTYFLISGLLPVLGTSSLMAYLIHMTLRIIEIHRVLKETGSFYLHCDQTTSHYLKLVCDSIFVTQGGDFKNEIVWCYGKWSNNITGYKKNHDIILFYCKGNQITFNKVPSNKVSKHYEKDYHTNLIDNNISQLIVYDEIKAKQLKESQKYNKIVDRIEQKQTSISDWWEISIINSQAKERLGDPTQKPEALLELIIKASSNEGDVVLDAYCGSGTTVAVAERLNRKWIGIDITFQSISLIQYRLKKTYPTQWNDIEANLKLDGIPQDRESAIALATKGDPLRKEFEKWAILTYTNNNAMINNKKGADGGIDGIMYFSDSDSKSNVIQNTLVFQVKSGKVTRSDIAKLNSDRQRENATLGIFITLQNPTKQMQQEALQVGKYHHKQLNKEHSIIEIVTIDDILSGTRLYLPLISAVVKSAEARSNVQLEIEIE